MVNLKILHIPSINNELVTALKNERLSKNIHIAEITGSVLEILRTLY